MNQNSLLGSHKNLNVTKKVKVQIAIIWVAKVVWPKPTIGKLFGRTLRLKLF